MNLGKKIKVARVTAGMTQEELAQKVHKTRPLISMIERNGKGNPETIEKILNVLKINFDHPMYLDINMSGSSTDYPRDLAYAEEKAADLYGHLQKEISFLRTLVMQQQQIIQNLSKED